jgi:hypothetical protein
VGAFLIVLMASGQPAQAWCIWGFGQCGPSNPLPGEYALDGNPIAKLTITLDKITSTLGPVIRVCVDLSMVELDRANGLLRSKPC